jgi:hypothetical protein
VHASFASCQNWVMVHASFAFASLFFMCLFPVCSILKALMLNFQYAAFLAFAAHQQVFVAHCSIRLFAF